MFKSVKLEVDVPFHLSTAAAHSAMHACKFVTHDAKFLPALNNWL